MTDGTRWKNSGNRGGSFGNGRFLTLRAADGTVHEETTTTEHLPDRTTKTTKPEGETRTETIVNKPIFKEPFHALAQGEEAASAGNRSGDTHVLRRGQSRRVVVCG
jgi:hypothetical protein